MNESLIPMTPEEAGARGVRTKRESLSSFESTFEPKTQLEAGLENAMAEPDREREETFRYLKEFHKQKRHQRKLEREDEAQEETRASVEAALHEDAERSRKSEQIMTGGAMAKNPDVGISYVEDANGRLVKKRPTAKRRASRKSPAAKVEDVMPYVRNENGELVPYYGEIYVEDENGDVVAAPPSPRRRFTPEDSARAHRTRDRRHTRSWWLKKLVAIVEGQETVTREQFYAHMAFGKSHGWGRPSPKR